MPKDTSGTSPSKLEPTSSGEKKSGQPTLSTNLTGTGKPSNDNLVLLILVHNSINTGTCDHFIIPFRSVQRYNLDAIDRGEVLDDDTPEEVKDAICELFYRLGIEESRHFKGNGRLGDMVKLCVNFKPGMAINRIVTITW